jgi:hypothetical protein
LADILADVERDMVASFTNTAQEQLEATAQRVFNHVANVEVRLNAQHTDLADKVKEEQQRRLSKAFNIVERAPPDVKPTLRQGLVVHPSIIRGSAANLVFL